VATILLGMRFANPHGVRPQLVVEFAVGVLAAILAAAFAVVGHNPTAAVHLGLIAALGLSLAGTFVCGHRSTRAR
jgi:hypothetical protein